jgi:hypothetical protein
MAYWRISRSTARPALAVALHYGLAVASVGTALGTTLILRNYNFPPRFISHFTLIAIAVTFLVRGDRSWFARSRTFQFGGEPPGEEPSPSSRVPLGILPNPLCVIQLVSELV